MTVAASFYAFAFWVGLVIPAILIVGAVVGRNLYPPEER